ncbi:MAG: Flp pilus assembly protein CpaB [Alphaproteobacteria bacterium]|nr:Flp pilus assembly protein CpaB [Alphaproteobacteria bacterium]
MLALAVVFGVVAVVLANVWLTSQKPTAQVSSAAPEPAATLVVASRDVTYGEALTPENLREIAWPASALPSGSYSKIADVTADGGHLALTSLSPNEPILKWKISGAGGRAALSEMVASGMRAVAIRVNDLGGVAGFVLPGDRVDVLYTKTASGTEQDGSSTDILIQNVKVLAADQTVDQKTGKPIQAKDVTVEVSEADSQKLALAQTVGIVSLALRAAGSSEVSQPKRIVSAELTTSPSAYLSAQKELEATVNAKIAQLEEMVQKSDSSKADMLGKLDDVAQKLTGQINSASGDTQAVKGKLAALEDLVKNSQNQSGDELKKRLAELLGSMNQKADAPAIVKAKTVTVSVAHGSKKEAVEVLAE